MANKVDTIVIGGGIIGCSIAYYLAKEGKEVLVIEKEGIGEGTSSSCDGFVYLQTKKPGIQMEMALESSNMYAKLSEELDYNVHYERPGGLVLIETQEQLEVMKQLVEKQKKCGIEVEIISGEEARKMEPTLSDTVIAASHSPLDGHVNPMDVTLGYARAAKNLGVEFWCHTPVTDVRVKDGKVEGVVTPKGEVEAEYVINACGVWAAEIGKMVGLDIPITPRRGQLMITEPLAPVFNKVLLCARYIAIKHNPSLAEGTSDRGLELGIGLGLEQTESGNIIIGNNREFVGYDKQTTYEVTREIAKYVSRFVPFLEDVHIIRTFSGLRPYTPDGAPILGPVNGIEGFIMAAGHEGDGIALAPITGRLIAELIVKGKSSTSLDTFNFSRFQ